MTLNEALQMYGFAKEIPGYRSWESMKRRCDKQSDPRYWEYGFIGITYPANWKSYKEFFADMGVRPPDKISLERINNNFGYSKHNCTWATAEEQAYNRSNTIYIKCHGMLFALKTAELICGVSKRTIWRWAHEETFKCLVKRYA
jgi:hypothetical protein